MDTKSQSENEEVDDRRPVEEVALVVPETDDPTMPVMTFRAWFLGISACVVLIFLNTFFTFRTQPLTISAILTQIVALPMGRFMAEALPRRRVRLFRGWSFDLNPGPFNVKEHVIITIFASCGVSVGGGDAYAIGAIVIMKVFYRQSVNFLCALIIVLTTQILGYGWAGMLRRYLVDPVEMWWPANLAQVSLFRALHEKDEPTKGGLSRIKFFLIFMIAGFAFYTLPGYLFPILSFFSWVCWIWPRSITAHQLGSGYHGLGVGAFNLDWAGISAYHGSPLVTPWFSILNTTVGFIVFIYIIMPLCYWKFNTFNAKTFPIFSNKLFTSTGRHYDITKILTPDFELNEAAFKDYGMLYLSPIFAISTGSGFLRFTAILVHVLLFHGSDIWRQTKSAARSKAKLDIHARLMKSYKEVPQWWYLILLLGSIAFSLLMAVIWKKEVQLPWWGFFFAFGLAWIITLPIGVIQATTNQQPGYDIMAQYMIGYILPGKPIASLIFKMYGRISTTHALSFLSDLKLGHYMKIPPRDMYMAQLVGTIVTGFVNLAIAWWMIGTIDNLCEVESLDPNSPWTCPKYRVTYDSSVIWGLIGPARLFGRDGMYSNLTWLFLVGAILPVPVWLFSKIYPEKKWIPLINIPVMAYGFAGMPPATPANIASWLLTGTIFNYFVFRYRKKWWQKYNYVLSASMDAGTAFMGVLLFFALQNQNKNLNWWGSEIDHCPLASCPTMSGVLVEGCPVF